MTLTVCLLGAMTFLRMGLSLAEKRAEGGSRSLRTAGHLLETLIVAATLVLLVIRPFGLQSFYIPSESMEPALRKDDLILVNKLSYRLGGFRRNEVVVFHKPSQSSFFGFGAEAEGDEYVKRVVGLPGDEIEIRSGSLWVNGAIVEEPFVEGLANYSLWPVRVPEKSLFVLGDNRANSNDSHRFGAVPMDRVIGRAVLVFWPPSRFGAIGR